LTETEVFFVVAREERPNRRLPLEGKLSAVRLTDEVFADTEQK